MVVSRKGKYAGENKAGLEFQKTDVRVFSPEQLEDDMSKQVLLEKAAVTSVLHKSLVHSELKFRCYDPQHCHRIINNIIIVIIIIMVIINTSIIMIMVTLIIPQSLSSYF